MSGRAGLHPHPDRLLPVDPAVREIARRLYDVVQGLPIISPHGHVDARVLLDDQPFADPASLLVTPDHYVTRLLHASGVPLEALGVGMASLTEAQSRTAWRMLCEHWAIFRATPVRYWFETELSEIFGIVERPSAGNADDLYDQIASRLAADEFRPRALYERFGIEVLATTDDPSDSLDAHRALQRDESWAGRVIPTFRPDRYLEPLTPGWPHLLARLSAAAGVDSATYSGFIGALENRRAHFVAHGATSADHSHLDVRAETLGAAEAERLHRRALDGDVTTAEATAYRRHLLFEMARMSADDGLVMTLHPAIYRNHHRSTAERFGADTGHDIPVQAEFTRALQPMLDRFGTHPNFQLVLFTVDETVFSREVAPLAGFYPSVFAGAPWWFLDAPNAMRRYLSAVVETAGFSRTSGFVDDTRAFCSIPARHDMARRINAGYLAGLVAEHQLDEDEAIDTARTLIDANPRRAFRL